MSATMHFELLGFYKSVRVPSVFKLSNKISSPTQHQYVSKDILGERSYGFFPFVVVSSNFHFESNTYEAPLEVSFRNMCVTSLLITTYPLKVAGFFDFIFFLM